VKDFFCRFAVYMVELEIQCLFLFECAIVHVIYFMIRLLKLELRSYRLCVIQY